jgi:SPP1 gp7 family putative phage head morphogenesis protein
MADKAHRLTDEKLEEMEKRLSAIYSRAEKEITQTAEDYFSKFAKQDEAKRKLLEQGKITEEEYTKWRKGKVMYGKRFTEMKEQCAKQLLSVNQAALAYVNGELPEVYALNYNALAGSVDGVGGYSFILVDADTVRNLAVTDTSLLPYKELDPAKDIPWNMKKINAETLQGILQGESMDKIAKRLRNVQEMNKTQAIRSARTIVTGAENKGRQDSYARAEADGIILKKEWLATNDGRTRHSHAVLDGAIIDQDKKFDNGLMYPGDPSGRPEEVYNCRCTLVAKVNGFKKAQVQKAMAEKQVEAPQTTTFTPAKTTAEAEAYAREHIFSGAYLGKTSYKGIDVDMANGINETLERITQKYGRKMSGIEVVNPKTAKGLKALGGSADAPFATNSLNGIVYINKDIIKNAKSLRAYTDKGDEAFRLVMANKDKLSGKMRTLAEIYEKAGKDLVDSSLEGMITHEYGHYLAVAINPKADVVSKIADGMGDHLVSGYSQHNVREYLAECFTEYERGDRSKLDPIVIELFEGAIKR